MPSATTTKTASAGTKRKSAPVKNVHVKESKKPKIDVAVRPALKKGKPAPVKKIEDSSDDDSDDSDSDGGVPLGYQFKKSGSDQEEGEDEESSDFEELPKAADGLHPDRAKAVVTNSQSSREAHAKQKALAQERKAAKPLADELARTKKIWERLRRKSHVPLEERKQLVGELFEIITGKIKDYVLKHDSVRVIQTAIKYANAEQRKLIAKELAGSYRQLAESRYAKFLIGKLLVQNDDEIRDIILPEFFGHVRRLIKHPEASWILDDVYRGVATRHQKATILREWYGAEFALFQKDKSEKITGDLADILAVDAGKRGPIMRSLQELINQLIQKKMTGFTLLHDAMLQYFLNAKQGTEEVTEYLEIIKGDEEGDLLKNLAFTRSGSRVVCLALAYGTAKDRKQILKTYKDTLQLMAGDPNAHIVILTAFEVIDDTVLTAKSIFPELLSKDNDKQVENIVFFANDINARITLLYLFQGRSRALFPGSHSTDLEILGEVDKVRFTTSKKDPEIRRSELVKALSPILLKAIPAAASELASTSFGLQFMTEVLLAAEGDKTAALEAIAKTAAGDPTYVQPGVAEGEPQIEPPSHLASTSHGGKMVKSLIAGGRYDAKTKAVVPVEPALNFADILYPNIKDYIIEWATGSSSFVVLALLESPTFSQKDEVLKVLKKNKTKLQKAATEETTDQKARRELAAIEKDSKDVKGKTKKSKPIKERELGNKGSALLLAMI
ncbi:pumilio domain member 6 [Cadophora gregata]|uniref:pumilio domain member 6 n=1 Tax=Cadophora gregata TaxID=51156 RepID=UPI0026DCEE4F|nr:pumilio domain member 6 [Cadophora gregata]KAK0104667.1 pumilio domain member 6 [Cadophora gregata]KAK0115250.1 pumilio domain member 6 [Cadophora gregata f. sp. sojae]